MAAGINAPIGQRSLAFSAGSPDLARRYSASAKKMPGDFPGKANPNYAKSGPGAETLLDGICPTTLSLPCSK